MQKRFSLLMIAVLSAIVSVAQSLNVVPTMTPEGGSFEDRVSVECTFPEGCVGGKYWINGAQIKANLYTGPIKLEHSCRLSVAGINKEGRVITDVVTRDFVVNKVTTPWTSTIPEEGSYRESFYMTQVVWNNATTAELNRKPFREGGDRHSEKPIWLVNEDTGKKVYQYGIDAIWEGGSVEHAFKVYVYTNYNTQPAGNYSLHIAAGVFMIDGKLYDKELSFGFKVADVSKAPLITPASGTYENEVEVSIKYPATSLYKFYKIGNGKTLQYNEPFVLKESATVSAYGMDASMSAKTETSTATYTIVKTVKPEPVHVDAPQLTRQGNTITMTAPEGCTIKYWKNDKMATAAFYTQPFSLDANCKISAVSIKTDGNGTVVAVSKEADLVVDDIPVPDTGIGMQVLLTEYGMETIHLTNISANQRFVSGYTDTGGNPLGFIWDVTSNNLTFLPTTINNMALGVSNDGTAYGWHVNIDEHGQVVEENPDAFGWCKNNRWTAAPAGFQPYGISGDNLILGSHNGKPATYATATGKVTSLSTKKGSVRCISADGKVMAGEVNGNAAYWVEGTLHEIADMSAAATMISDNGQWIAGQFFRYNIAEGKLIPTVSTSTVYNGLAVERITSIDNEGTLYGNYDGSYAQGNGSAIICTTDGEWKYLADVLTDEGINWGDFIITGCHAVSGDRNVIAMTAFPVGMSTDNEFTRGMVIRRNVPLYHQPPYALTAEQMRGIEVVKLSWNAPKADAQDIKSFTVVRNGNEIATTEAATLCYYDKDVEVGSTYIYNVRINYNNGDVSADSYAAEITVEMSSHKPVRQLTLRQSGANDINLSWGAPATSLPTLQYFNEEAQTQAFGTEHYSSEWGIRIPASDLEQYDGMQIRTFHFLPTGKQKGYRLNLYTAKAGTDGYDTMPFYTQTIDPETLNYGSLNTITLHTPQDLPKGKDLLVGLLISGESSATDDMLGISYEGFKSGYSDLCRVMGVHDKMVAISKNSSSTTEVTLPLGLGVCTEDMRLAAEVKEYSIEQDGNELVRTKELRHKLEGLAEKKYTFGVRAVYGDGEMSEATTAEIDLRQDKSVFEPVTELQTKSNADGTVDMTWPMAMNDDKRELHWGDMTPSVGMPMMSTFDQFTIASVYPATMVNPYAGDYEITGMYYMPLADGLFTIMLEDGMSDHYLQYIEHDDYVPGQINVVNFDEPITVNGSSNYILSIDAYDVLEGEVPFAFDSSNKNVQGYSDLIRVVTDPDNPTSYSNLYEFLQWNEKPNWFMGLIIRLKEAKPLPVDYYEVNIDGEVAAQVHENSYTSLPLTKGSHTARIDVRYTGNNEMVEGKPVTFNIERDSRLVFTPGEGVFILGLPADMSKGVAEPTMLAPAYAATFKVNNAEMASLDAGKAYNISEFIDQKKGVLDLSKFMGVGSAKDFVIRTMDGESYQLGDNAPDGKTWSTSHLMAAVPSSAADSCYTMGVYDHWDCPVVMTEDKELTDGKTSGIEVNFGKAHDGLVVRKVEFTLVTDRSEGIFATNADKLVVKATVGNKTTEKTIGADDVQFINKADNGLSYYSCSIDVDCPQFGTMQESDLGELKVSVTGFNKPNIRCWLPRTIDETGLYPTHSQYIRTGNDAQQPSNADVCINLRGYYNYLGNWGIPQGKQEYGEVVPMGDYVQVYYSPDEPGYEGPYQGEVTFPVECSYGAEDLIIGYSPSWIHDFEFETSQWKDYGAILISMHADALPTDMTGRVDEVRIMTADGSSSYSIMVKQGEIDYNGISQIVSLDSQSRIYDLQGRRIAKPVKGQIYIVNGKKMVK